MGIVKNLVFGLCLVLLICTGGCAREECFVAIKSEEIYMDIDSARNLPAVASSKKNEITYHSSDESVAWYSDGLLISGKPGTCVVYAKTGDVVSELVTVHVRDFMKESSELRDKIEELYKNGEMSEFIANELSERYDIFPDYAKAVVDNFYIVSMFRDYSDENMVYITSSGKKYHQSRCGRLNGKVREIPLNLAMLEELTACDDCIK